MDLILSHVGADFDALASMVAARKLYPGAVMAFTGAPEASVKEFLTLHRAHFPVEPVSEFLQAQVRRVVLVDTRNPSRLGPFRQRIHDKEIELHIYDHHPPVAESIQGDLEVVKRYGAAVTVVLEKVREQSATLSELEATLCLLGIYEETGNLTFPSTTPEDARAVAWLLEQGASLTLVPRFSRPVLGYDQHQLLEDLIHSLEAVSVHGFTVHLCTAERDHYVSDLGLLAHRIFELEQSDVVICMVGMRGRVHLVGRSRENALDVGKALEQFGGGGHATAASAAVPQTDLVALRRSLLEVLEQTLPDNLRARDLMTPSVQCLDIDRGMTVAEAGQALRQLGHTAACVRRGKEIVGMVSRGDVDKALRHDLGHSPVSAYMSSPVVSVTPDTPLEEIQALLVERDIGRVPVMEQGRLAGIVSRTDILAALYTSRPRRSIPAVTVPAELLRLRGELLALLRLAGAVGRQTGVEVYVVGGFVRDLLLGVENTDVDLVAEGDGIAFAQVLGDRLGGRVHPHHKFGTAVLVLPEGFPVGAGKLFKLDVATARTETYCRPAALPAVRGSTLKQDLFRRDFTINAMAVRLAPNHFGQLIDPFGSRRDLELGLIRVLHNHSFVDDPTRILRAVRFEQRLGFRIEQTTEHLLRSALSQDIFAYVTPERVRDEFQLILGEARPIPILRRLQALKILRCLHPALQVDERTLRRLEQVPAVLAEFPQLPVERWRLYLMALVSRLRQSELEELTRRYRMPPMPWRPGEEPARLLRRLARRRTRPSEVCRTLEPLSPEAILYLALLGPAESVRSRIRIYLEDLRHRERWVTGSDLQRMGLPPGPTYRQVLQQVRDAQLDGLLGSREEALEWVAAGFLSAGGGAESVEAQGRGP
ncbi:MAG: CBS domain-containing protein [Armatimonadetes bacterium]|nr:CBS domain-containing protein [Armatimonadota bacterium]